MEELRKLEKKSGGDWVVSSMQDLSPGDIFRMFEPTGEPVQWKGYEWKVISEPHRVINEKGVNTWGVNVEEILGEEE